MNQKGFSIIELLITISILVLFTGFVFVDFKTSTKKQELKDSVNLLGSNIKKVRNWTLIGKTLKNNSLPQGGYGIYLNENKYSIFADINVNSVFDDKDILLDKIELNENILILSKKNIVFKPPYADIYINNKKEEQDEEIEIKHIKLNKTKKIKINAIIGRITY